MKKLSRILALVLSLMMALTCCAFAEEAAADTGLYTLSVFDPVVYYNDAPMIDLTGATLDLNAAVTDTGLIGLIANLFAGENYDYVAGATAQLDPTGVTAWLDGMSNTYNINVAALAGMNPYDILAAVPLRTLLASADLSALQSVAITPEMRVAMAAQLFSSIAGEPSGSVYPLSITAERGRASLEALGDLIAQADAEAAAEYKAALAEDPSLTFTLEGTMTADGASIVVDAAGALINSTESLPVTLKYSDDMATIAGELAINNADGSALASLSGESVTTPTADGRSATNALFTLSSEGETDITLSYTATPAEGSAQVDHLVSISAPSEAISIDFLVQTGTHPEGVGFNLGLFANQNEEYYGLGLQYMGDNYNAEGEAAPYHNGYLYLFAENDTESYALELGLMMQKQDVNTVDWALPTEGAIDVMSMDEAQQQTAMMEASTVLQNALPTLMAGVPGLSALMGGAEMPAE